jgi:hypothetical protein
VKRLILTLESAFVALGVGGAIISAAGAGERLIEIGEEQEGKVGVKSAAHGLVHPQNALAAQLAAASLISLRRIRKAIAEDNAATVEGGRDDLGDALGAIGEHQAELGHRVKVLRLRIEEQAAHAIAETRTPGLAGQGNREALAFKVGRELAELGGFAGAVKAFKCEEEAHKGRVQDCNTD